MRFFFFYYTYVIVIKTKYVNAQMHYRKKIDFIEFYNLFLRNSQFNV